MEILKSYLTFVIGLEQFAANAAFVHNIIELPLLTQIPNMPKYMLGVINLRGKSLPVMDTRIKFGIKNTAITPNTCIIIIEVSIDTKQVQIGLLVDAVSEVIELEPNEIKPAPSIGKNIKNEIILGVFQSNDRFTMILDLNKVVNNSEIQKIKNNLV